MNAFWIALQFLTRIPVPAGVAYTPQQIGRSVAWYPVVGLLLGGLLVAVTTLMQNSPPLLVGALLLLVWVGLTGALHIDGVADMADAWVGGHGDRERTLDIMKDPSSGPVGVTAVVLVLLLKFAALVVLVPANHMFVLVAPVLGRSAAALLLLTTPYCRNHGTAVDMVQHMSRGVVSVLLLLVAVLALVLSGLNGLGLLLVGLLLFMVYRRALLQRLQGFTGDAAGALIELTEVVILFFAACIIDP